MDKQQLTGLIRRTFNETPGNTADIIPGRDERFAGVPFFSEPLIGFGNAADPLFEEYRKPGVIGPWFRTPEEWMEGAQTVVSIFFPASDEVKRSNREAAEGVSSLLWSYARIEGQQFIDRTMLSLKDRLEELGIRACVPSCDSRFAAVKAGKGMEGYGELPVTTFGSNWSERHAAYVCGLGTFGLSKGIITEKGMAGRFSSILTDLALQPDERPYSGLYDHCIRCGACVRRCPVNAIDPVTGKDHLTCAGNVVRSGQVLAPRYGCGLCQTGVPCESGIPRSR